jgi:putative spermidine/putrescine transport system permease protein
LNKHIDNKIKKSKTYLLALLPFIVIVVFFLAVPIVMIIVRSFMPAGAVGFTLDNFSSIFTRKLYQQAVLNSIIVSVCSALVGLVIGFLGANAAHGSNGKTKTFFMSVLNMTSNFAGIPLAFAYIILLGSAGVLVMFGKQFGIGFLADFDLYNIWGLLLTYIYFQIPLATLLLIPAFDGLKNEWRESVRLMGGNEQKYWFRVGIPVLLPSILGTLSVLFANAVAAYATAYALLAANFSLLPIRISEQFVGDVVQHKEFGSALAVILMLLMVLAIFVNNRILKNNRGAMIR